MDRVVAFCALARWRGFIAVSESDEGLTLHGGKPWYLDRARQEEFNRNIESLAKWIEGAIQRFRSGVKNSRVIEVHNTCHYVFIVDEALVVRETRKFLLDE